MHTLIATIATHDSWEHDGPPWPVRLLFVAVLVGLAVALFVFLRRRSAPNVHQRANAHAAELIAEQYARGDIDLAEYQSRLDNLTPVRRSKKRG